MLDIDNNTNVAELDLANFASRKKYLTCCNNFLKVLEERKKSFPRKRPEIIALKSEIITNGIDTFRETQKPFREQLKNFRENPACLPPDLIKFKNNCLKDDLLLLEKISNTDENSTEKKLLKQYKISLDLEHMKKCNELVNFLQNEIESFTRKVKKFEKDNQSDKAYAAKTLIKDFKKHQETLLQDAYLISPKTETTNSEDATEKSKIPENYFSTFATTIETSIEKGKVTLGHHTDHIMPAIKAIIGTIVASVLLIPTFGQSRHWMPFFSMPKTESIEELDKTESFVKSLSAA